MIFQFLTDPAVQRVSLLVLALLLAACDPGNSTGGGGSPY
jgi:hypothetical protein